jgi:hypothetical protein
MIVIQAVSPKGGKVLPLYYSEETYTIEGAEESVRQMGMVVVSSSQRV